MMKNVLILASAIFFASGAFASSSSVEAGGVRYASHVAISTGVSPSISIEEVRKEVFEGMGGCDQAIFTNEDYLAVSLRPLVPRVGHVRITSLKNTTQVFDISTDARVTDIKVVGDIAYVLTGVTLEAWDISSEKQLFKYATHPEAAPDLDWRKRAEGFVLSGNRAIIAHSVLGVTVLDLASGKFVKILPMITVSSAQDIALLSADQAVIAVDNDNEATFRGMYLMNLRSLAFTKKIKIDNAFPQAVRVLDGDRLMLMYSNAVWKFGKSQALAAAREPKPSIRAWQFPGLNVVDMQGKVAFDSKYLYGCFKMWESEATPTPFKPMAFDLKALRLN